MRQVLKASGISKEETAANPQAVLDVLTQLEDLQQFLLLKYRMPSSLDAWVPASPNI